MSRAPKFKNNCGGGGWEGVQPPRKGSGGPGRQPLGRCARTGVGVEDDLLQAPHHLVKIVIVLVPGPVVRHLEVLLVIVFFTIAHVHNSLSCLLIFVVLLLLLLLLLLHIVVHFDLLIVHLSCIQICGRGR